MNRMAIATYAAALAALFLGAGTFTTARAAQAPISAQCASALDAANVDEAYKFIPDKPDERNKDVALGDVIELRISNLGGLAKDCTNMPLVLFLNGYSMTALKPNPLVLPSAGILRFTLNFASAARHSWVPILGYPGFNPRQVLVSVGIEDQYPVKASADKATLNVNAIANVWFAIWAGAFVVLACAFYWCVRHTNIIRDGQPAAAAAGVQGTYSLAKSQGALWCFVIIAAYLLIGLVTGDFTNSINSTALILLGIGAGTVIGSAVIDASKDGQDVTKKVQEIADTKAKLGAIDQRLAEIDKAREDKTITADQRSALDKEKADKQSEKDKTTSDYRKLTQQNEQFLTDILSDANGVSFHRFQMAAWTLVLSIIFIKGVYENLAMPTFDTTLMGLLGLSAGTYLGLKIPEATMPNK
jgi:hypothetical protein